MHSKVTQTIANILNVKKERKTKRIEINGDFIFSKG